MPHIYLEVSRYGLENEWLVTQNPGGKEEYCTITSGGKQWDITREEEACNLDAARSWPHFRADSTRLISSVAFGASSATSTANTFEIHGNIPSVLASLRN